MNTEDQRSGQKRRSKVNRRKFNDSDTPILIKEVNKTGEPEKRGENINKVFIEIRIIEKVGILNMGVVVIIGGEKYVEAKRKSRLCGETDTPNHYSTNYHYSSYPTFWSGTASAT